ncbi:Spy/CpxP family protein refolding chaperone [Gluconobacter cerevisiae]|nr:Spy/CpxP family protein refolding chaperone [Gluconobacter cerevisiae]
MTILRPTALLPAMVALGLMGTPLLASAQAHHVSGWVQPSLGGPRGAPGHMMPPVPPGVTLTADQKTKLKAIFEKAHQDERALRLEGRAIEEKIHDALSSVGDLDRATLTDLNGQENELKAKVSALHLETMEQLHDLLTPAQRQQGKETMTKLKALHEQMKALMGHPPEGEPDDMP